MRKLLKIIGYLFLGVIALCILGAGMLFGYQMYLKRGVIDISEWKSYYMNDIPVQTSEFKDDFEDIFQRVSDRYDYIKRKRLNMDSLHQVYTSRLDTLQTKIGYSMLVREFFADLHAGHADLAFESWGLGGDIAVVEQRIFIDYPRIQLKKAGMQQGDEIVAVDGVPVQQWITENEKFISASTPAYRYLRSALEVMLSYTDSVRTFSIVREGQPLEMTMKLHSEDNLDGPIRYQATEWKRINDDCGYLAVNEMSSRVLDTLDTAMGHLRDLPNLIIDVRRNGGGDSQIGDTLATYLIKGDRQAWNGHLLHQRNDCYTGNVYLLMGTYSFSAAESFIITMKESGDAVLVGEPSAGDSGGFPQFFRSKHGICFRLPIIDRMQTPGGHPLEGVAIKPHHVVKQTVADFLEGRDTQLEYVLSQLK